MDFPTIAEIAKDEHIAAQIPVNENEDPKDSWHLDLLSSDDILTTDWPEPVWAVPGLLTAGLAILAGAPKVGKSWLSLQIAQTVAAGGVVLERKVDQGSVLYLALEDPPRRLKERMSKQHWPTGLQVQFLTVGSFYDRIGDLRDGGAKRIANQIERVGYRLVVIDTLSRAIFGKQKEAEDMTAWLSPLQEIAHEQNCVILFVDHHRKMKGYDPDVIADILGSTAKGAMVDTAIGLYRERGKAGAKLAITGREIEERTLSIKMDWPTGSWQIEDNADGISSQQAELLDTLNELKTSTSSELGKVTGINKGTVHKQLSELENRGLVSKNGPSWRILSQNDIC